jgi:hypothetical protein
MESRTALAAYSISSEFSKNQGQVTSGSGLDGSFQLAVMGNGVAPLDIPTEKFPKKVESEKPAAKKPKATPKVTQKASKPEKEKVNVAKAKKAPAKETATEEEEGFFAKTLKTLVGDDGKKNPASKSLVQKSAGKAPEPAKEEEGLLSKTLSTLVGDDEDKSKPVSKPQPQKTASKKPEPEKEEEGLLTKTLKSLVGSDEKEEKKEKTAKKKSLSPINMAPTAKATHKKEKEESKTAKSETKKTIKDSFEKLIGVGAVDKEDVKPEPKVVKKAEVKKVVEKKAPPKPERITARKYIEDEEKQYNKDRKVVKGKNVLKDSFQKLIADDDKQKALAK